MPELKEKIKSLRESRKLTQAALGALVGESQVTVGGWEKGRTTPNIDQLRRLSEALEVPLTELVDTGEAVLQTGTPYFPDVNASAGLNYLSLQNKPYSVPISIPNVKADAFINVFGDSMYPKYCSGEIIGIKEVEKDMVMFGHAYVIQMKDGEAYLKYIKKGADDQHWLLVSENDHYEPREFHLKYIDKVFIIKAVITKTTR